METHGGDGRKKRKRAPRRGRRKSTSASPPPSPPPPPSVGTGPGDGAAPPPSRAPPPSGPGDGGAPTARTTRKPADAAAPPSSFAPPPSGSDDGGTSRKGNSAAAALPSPAPPPSVRTGPGNGDATSKRAGSPLERDRKRGKRTVVEEQSSGRDGGHPTGGPSDAPAAPTPPPEDVVVPAADASGGGGGGGSPDAPAAPTPQSEDVAVPAADASGGGGGGGSPDAPAAALTAPALAGISVAHTPNLPLRFEGLLRNITSLIPDYESKGKSYECSLSRMNSFLVWSKSRMALFFEWSDDESEATCWMHDLVKKKHFKFTVNAAFAHEMDNINVERAAIAFSTNFIGGDEYWSDLKDMILNMFGSSEDNGLKAYDYMYVFTRVGSSVYFRHFKITSLPKAGDPSSGLVLTEINTMFCLNLVNDHGTPSSSNIGPQLPNDQALTKLFLCPVTLYSISNGHTGSCLPHEVVFCEKLYSVFLENGFYVSSLQELEGYNVSLAEIVVLEPLLKIKHIIGSATNKTCCFARERCKSVLQSLFAEFAMLLESGKCVSEAGHILMHHVLVRGTNVRLYGVELTDYTEYLAKRTVEKLVTMVRNCFPSGMIPLDLGEFLYDLEKNPLDQIRLAKDDCSLMKAKDRWTLLMNINSEYMTNVKAKPTVSDGMDDQINDITFFDECPYAEDWKQIMEDNEYMVQICNLEESSDQKNGSDEVKNPFVMSRIKKKRKMNKNTSSIHKFAQKKEDTLNEGKLQFSSKTIFLMHMPEKARKDGIIPFRLGMADYILTAYFPLYLRFLQKRMREVKEQSGRFKKRKRPSYVVRGQGQ